MIGSKVASDKPTIFIWSLSVKWANFLIFFAGQSGLVQYKNSDVLSSLHFLSVFSPHTGHVSGITICFPFFVKFWSICGMIILLLYIVIMSSYPNCRFWRTLILWTEALFTIVPSNSTGSNIATGFISPVRLADHSTSRSVVSAVSSFHLKAMECLGNFPVIPSDCP